jgi:hypothetical protein
VLGFNSLNMNARAVSGAIAGPACVYALNPIVDEAVYKNGDGVINSSCGMIVNSSSAAALYVNGNDTVDMQIGVVGNYVANGSDTFSPMPVPGIAPGRDPLANVPAPAVGACDHTNFTQNFSSGSSSTNTVNLSPGGEPISAARLKEMPFMKLCVDCKNQSEKAAEHVTLHDEV